MRFRSPVVCAGPANQDFTAPFKIIRPGRSCATLSGMDDVVEIELLGCDYAAVCTRPGCPHYPATTIIRYLDNQGRALRQFEVCDRHTEVTVRREELAGRRLRDLR